ncbi:hypothetical protein QKW35_05315 [Pontibacterium granulatum]|uniref:hypothetical protein n=1 Tax=Pontibacterium granulatum TaxID=2036029 RepID=UPI00249A5654|nr:hypothetical protein [Pontibacterium granulatum]MDI3323790.1 hypothetical protein [Pontibacterium granulatum]
MSQAYLVAAAKISDGDGSMASVEERIQQLNTLGITPHTLNIEPLNSDWNAPEQPDYFRSGCGPIEALERARKLISEGTPAVVIRGEDLIKSGYPRDERLQLMAVYGEDYPLTQAYDDVAQQFIQHQQIDADTFCATAEALFENYQRTYLNNLASKDDAVDASQATPGTRWFERITPLFRGVDCANPLVDFTGAVLVCDDKTTAALEIPQQQRVAVKGVGLGRLPLDGKEAIDSIARYDHMEAAYRQACTLANLDFRDIFMHGEALLDTYTCYPVVPMAFLLKTGLVKRIERIPAFLKEYEITVTGGMNLARAPWNNPALNGLICMYQKLTSGEIPLGAVHGNGGLGYRQGVAILAREAD